MVKCSTATCRRNAAAECRKAGKRYCGECCLARAGPCPKHGPGSPLPLAEEGAPLAPGKRGAPKPAPKRPASKAVAVPPPAPADDEAASASSDDSPPTAPSVSSSEHDLGSKSEMVDLRTAARLFAAFQREAAPPVPSREAPLPVADIMDPPSDADDDDARTAKRVAAVTSAAHQKAYERKLRLTRDELAQYSVQDILFCEELWQRWVEASADDAVRGARRKELLQALAGALGTSVPSASVIGTAPSGASRFLVELAGLLLEPELPATASTPAPPTLRSRLTSAIGLRARFAALEKSSSRANAQAWWAVTGPMSTITPPVDAAFLAAWRKRQVSTRGVPPAATRPSAAPPPPSTQGKRSRGSRGRAPPVRLSGGRGRNRGGTTPPPKRQGAPPGPRPTFADFKKFMQQAAT